MTGKSTPPIQSTELTDLVDPSSLSQAESDMRLPPFRKFRLMVSISMSSSGAPSRVSFISLPSALHTSCMLLLFLSKSWNLSRSVQYDKVHEKSQKEAKKQGFYSYSIRHFYGPNLKFFDCHTVSYAYTVLRYVKNDDKFGINNQNIIR